MSQVYSQSPASQHLIAKYTPRSHAPESRSPTPTESQKGEGTNLSAAEVTYPEVPTSAAVSRPHASSTASSSSTRSQTLQRKPSYHRERPQKASRPPITRAVPFQATSPPRSVPSNASALVNKEKSSMWGLPSLVQSNINPYQAQLLQEAQHLQCQPPSRQESDSSSFYSRESSPDSELNQSFSYTSSSSSNSSQDDDFNDRMPRRMQRLPRLDTRRERVLLPSSQQVLQDRERDHQYITHSPHRITKSPHTYEHIYHHSPREMAHRVKAHIFEHQPQSSTAPSSSRVSSNNSPTSPIATKSAQKPEKRVHFHPEALGAKNGHRRYMNDVRGEWDRLKSRHARSRPQYDQDRRRDHDEESTQDGRKQRYHERSGRRKRNDYFD